MRPRTIRLLSTFSFLGLLPQLAAAQAVVRDHAGPTAQSRFGEAVAGGGDVDLDGVPDIVVGTPGFDLSQPDGGRAVVYSGATGERLLTLYGFTFQGQYGFAVDVLGDVDGDGRAELLVGAPTDNLNATFLGSVKIASGTDGFPLMSRGGESSGDQFGYSVAAVGDVDDDGIPDYAVGAPRADFTGTSSGSAYLFSGATNDLLFRVDGSSSFGRFGTSVDGIEDYDGDGTADWIVGAPRESRDGGLRNGAVYVLSGRDGSQLAVFAGASDLGEFGTSVSGVGDVDGDGLAELLVGAPFAEVFGVARAGTATVLSSSGSVLFTLFGDTEDGQFGAVVRGGGDANGDGTPDLAVASSSHASFVSSGTVHVFSGSDGALLFERTSPSEDAFDGFGVALDFTGDLNGDGKDDLVVGASTASVGAPLNGRVDVLLSDASEPEAYCFAAANSTGVGTRIGSAGAPSVGLNQFQLTVRDAVRGSGLFFYGSTRVLAFQGDGFRCVGGMTARLNTAVPVRVDGTAELALDFTAPPLSAGPRAILPGSTWNFQFWYRDSLGPLGNGSNLSDALEVTFVP